MKRLIDLIVNAAKLLGAESFPVILSSIIDKTKTLDVEKRHKESSYAAELNYHTVNMQSRFPNPRDNNKRTPARWKDEPYFCRVSIGMYKLLTDEDKKDFKYALQRGMDIVFRREYDFSQLKNQIKSIQQETVNKANADTDDSIDIDISKNDFKEKDNNKGEDLKKLSELIKERNKIDNSIADMIGRPATTGHIGEYIASKLFNIRLEESATRKSIDGYFTNGNFSDKSVNIKFYPKKENLLDLFEKELPDYFLVITGPSSPAISSRGQTRPLIINYVFLFDSIILLEKLIGVKIGIATSVRSYLWDKAEIYPNANNNEFILTKEQIDLIELFK